jgi:YVTN family beta-propeller protein
MALSACATTRPAAPLPPPRAEGEGEIHVFALPLPSDAERITFTLEGLSAIRQGGGEVPLELARREVSAADLREQRLLAWGRVAPADYAGLSLQAGSATLAREGEQVRLLVDPEPARSDRGFRVSAGAAVVIWVDLGEAFAVRGGFSFTPAFTPTIAPQIPPQVALYCTSVAGASVTVIDRSARRVTGVVPTGAAPRGIALEERGRRAYVALSREDQIEILDTAAGAAIGRIRLAPGDGPTEVALAPDGTLVVLNERSRTVSFVDPTAAVETGRVRVGDGPSALLLDRSGRRAYVANRAAGTVTAIDVGNRAVVATAPTDPEPLHVQLSRDGARLYVIHRGSPDLLVLGLPSLEPIARAYLGLGVTTFRVDPRSDLLYVSRGDERRISVYDPVSLQQVDQFDVPGAVSYMAIDHTVNALLALVPERSAVAVVDLTSRRVVSQIPVGPESFRLALAGERP